MEVDHCPCSSQDGMAERRRTFKLQGLAVGDLVEKRSLPLLWAPSGLPQQELPFVPVSSLQEDTRLLSLAASKVRGLLRLQQQQTRTDLVVTPCMMTLLPSLMPVS